MNKVLNKYNVIGDDFFYHHTVTEENGETYYHGPEVHRQYEVLYLIRGEISYIIEGETYNATPGDMIFVSPNEIHTIKIDGNSVYERAVVLFDMSIMERLISGADVKLSPFTIENAKKLRVIDKNTVSRYGIWKTLSAMIECDEPEPYKRLTVVAKLIEFMISLDKIAGDAGTTPPTEVDPLIQRITEYIERNIDKPISLHEMSRELFVSTSTLSHRFSEYMNMPLNRFIAVKKMHRADELMREGHSASEVSRLVGYENYTSFFYNFKRIMGRSPTSKPLTD
jgi:AraC-like DNA-binding protein